MSEEETIEGLKRKLEQMSKSQSGVDRAWQAEKKRADELEKRLMSTGSEAELLARLDRVQKGYAERERKLELRYYAREKCLETGIPFDLLADLDLPDEVFIERKIAQFAQGIEAATLQEVNARLVSTAKPKAGAERTIENLQSSFRNLRASPSHGALNAEFDAMAARDAKKVSS